MNLCVSIGETDVCECGFVFMWHVCKYMWCVVGLVCGCGMCMGCPWCVCGVCGVGVCGCGCMGDICGVCVVCV